MEVVSDLIKDVTIPKMIKIKQKFDRNSIPSEQIRLTVLEGLRRNEIASQVKPGMRIAITCGSRGINSVAIMVKAMVDFVKECQATPFIVAAMGSHGGATAQGQRQILADYGITEEIMKCEIESSMETVEIGRTDKGEPVMMDKAAATADGILLFNRIKPHTSYRGPYESGLMKMMAIGLGKQAGAAAIHGQSPSLMAELIPQYGLTILKSKNIIGGIAVVENSFDYPYIIKALTAEEIVTEEPRLKDISYETIATLKFDACDVLVIDKIGKNISGDGMDPNVSGRFCTKYASGGISAEKIVLLDLTDETHGNAQGIGLADVITRRLYDKMKLEMTYPTAVTNTFLHLMKIPMIMDNDREALQLALISCTEGDRKNRKVIHVEDTAHIEYLEISETMLAEAKDNPYIEILSEPYELKFDKEGNLLKEDI